MAFRSAIDTPQSARLSGWATNEDGLPCTIRVQVGGQSPFEIVSDLHRPDLIAHGLSQGLGGFVVDLAPYLSDGENEVALTLPDGSHVAGSPMRRILREDGSVVTYRGSIAATSSTILSGWAVTDAGDCCTIIVEVNGTEVRREETYLPRPDLVAVGVGQGKGGFDIDLSPYLKSGENQVAVRFPNGAHLSTSPLTRIVDDEDAPASQPDPGPAQAEFPAPPSAALVQPPEEPRPEAELAGKAQMPSLIELDEISLDDISYAVASGAVAVAPPDIPPLSLKAKEEESEAETAMTQVEARPAGGWLARITRSRRR